MNLKLLRSRTKRSPFRSGWRTISLCVLLWGGFASDGQTKELTAKEIIKKATSSGAVSFKEGQAEIEMEITQASGRVRKNTMSLKMRKSKAGLSQTMVRFEKPAAVKGTSFLVREKKKSITRSVRFCASDKSGSTNCRREQHPLLFWFRFLLCGFNADATKRAGKRPDKKIGRRESRRTSHLRDSDGYARRSALW